jgi:prefoldin beta subunit
MIEKNKEDKNKKIQEMQFLEQNFQNLLLQKQAFQLELTETQSALKELKNSGDEVFKIIGQLMIKTEKSKTEKELLDKEKLLELRIKTFEKQENTFSEKLEELKRDIIEK